MTQVKSKDCQSHIPGWKMSIMFGNFALYSRLHVFALTCAAVVSFITYPDGARASSTVTKEQNGAEDSLLRRLYTPYSRHRPSPVAPLSIETQLRAGTDSETEMSGNFREKPSVIDYPSNPVLFTQGSFSSNQRGPDNREYQGRVTKEWKGHGVGGEKPTRGTFAGQPQQGGAWQSKGNDQNLAQTGNYYSSYSGIFRKSSPKEAGSPLHQSLSRIWDHEYTKNEGKAPRMDSPVADEDKSTVGKYFYSSLFPSQNSARWSPPAQRGHYGAHDETNVLPAVPAWSTSSGIQSSKFPSVSSRPAPRETSISKSSEAPVIKRNPWPEKLRSSITEGSGETLGHKKAQSYLFKDSQTSVNAATGNGRGLRVSNAATMPQIAAGVQVYSRLNFQHGEESSRRDNVLYRDSSVPRYVGQTDSFTKYQPITSLFPPLHATTQPPTRLSLRPVTAKSKDVQSFVPTPHSWDASRSEKSVPGGRVNTTTRRSMQDAKQGRSTKSIYGLRGFKNPPWQAAKEPSGSKQSSPRYRFDKGRDYTFKIANRFPSLSPKYSFGRRGAPTAAAAPADRERTPKVYASPPPGNQITTVSTPGPFTSGLKLPERDAGTSRNLKQKPLTAYKRIYGLKGFNTRPLEGAKTSEPDTSAALQQGVELRSAQTWQPRRIHTLNDRAGETKPESKDSSAASQSEASSEDLQPPLKTAGRSPQLTTFTPDYTFYGFLHANNRTAHAHNKKQWKYSQRSPGILSSARLRSAGSPKAAPTSEPGTTRKLPAAKATLLSSSIGGTVKGRRVKANHAGAKNLSGSTPGDGTGNAAIVRLPKRPARVQAVTYSDILGSASFSGVGAANQTQVTSADEVYFPNRTATTKINGSLDNWTLNPDDGAHRVENTSLEGDFSGVKEDKLRKSEDDEMKTSDLFLDNEGSGAFNASDALSSVTGGQGAGEDLLELEYLRISAGNVSFKSLKRPHPGRAADTS